MEDARTFQDFPCGGFGALDFLQPFAHEPAKLLMFPFGHHGSTKLQFLFLERFKIFFLEENSAGARILNRHVVIFGHIQNQRIYGL
jgi:hypothetical protein